jgi:hypothetical protein
VVLERDRADALAGRGKERIEHGGRSDEDRRLAKADPGNAGSQRWISSVERRGLFNVKKIAICDFHELGV